jgi:hypothetical protein
VQAEDLRVLRVEQLECLRIVSTEYENHLNVTPACRRSLWIVDKQLTAAGSKAVTRRLKTKVSQRTACASFGRHLPAVESVFVRLRQWTDDALQSCMCAQVTESSRRIWHHQTCKAADIVRASGRIAI